MFCLTVECNKLSEMKMIKMVPVLYSVIFAFLCIALPSFPFPLYAVFNCLSLLELANHSTCIMISHTKIFVHNSWKYLHTTNRKLV